MEYDILAALGVFLVFYVTTNFVNISLNSVFALILSILLVGVIVAKKDEQKELFIGQMEQKLRLLDPTSKLSALYLDPNIINVMYDMYDYRIYSSKNFDEALKGMNRVLNAKRKSNLELKPEYAHYDLARDGMVSAMNNLLAMYTKLPVLGKDNFRVGIDKLHVLMQRHLDEIQRRVKTDAKEITRHTQYRHKDQLLPFKNDNAFKYFV